MIKFDTYRIIWQTLLLWGLWILITISLTNGFQDPERVLKRGLSSIIGFVIIFQINIRYFLPRFFFKKKYLSFCIAGAVLLGTILILLNHEIFPWSKLFYVPMMVLDDETNSLTRVIGIKWMRELTPFIIAFLGSTLLEVSRYANDKETQTIRLEKEKMETELKFLKSQINPHFLFNALNNIYSLSVMQAPQTSESIMQLSEILRYMVYESNDRNVRLESEINYINNFVNLKRMKDSKGMDVKININVAKSDLMIAPLLFIPLVENAFKHSKIEDLKTGFIEINLKGNTKIIEFDVINSIPQNKFTKDKVGGVGLENIKQRLNLLYPGDQHELIINQTEKDFKVSLKLTA